MATRDYTLGKGKVLFKRAAATVGGVSYPADVAYLDLGNAPAFTVNTTIDKLEHFSSRSGISKKDLEVITKLTMAGSFTLDEPNAANLAMFLMSADGAEAFTQGTITTENADQITAYVANRWYPIVKTGAGTAGVGAATTLPVSNASAPALTPTGSGPNTTARTVQVLVASGSGGTATIKVSVDNSDWSTGVALTAGAKVFDLTGDAIEDLLNGVTLTFASTGTGLAVGDMYSFALTYTGGLKQYSNCTAVTVSGKTEGTDFVLDLGAGLIMFYTGGGGNATPVVTATANASRTMTKGGTLTSLKGDLYFVGDPPQGRIVDVMGFCSLTPNGDWALIGEDWMQVQFNIEFLEVAGVPEMVKVIDRGKAGSL